VGGGEFDAACIIWCISKQQLKYWA